MGGDNSVKQLEIKDKKYVNAGIIMINSKKWREENLFSKIKKYSISNDKLLISGDMGALNKITDGKKLLIHPKYNYIETWWANYYNEYKDSDIDRYKEASKNPVLIHFTGVKPNNYENFHSYKINWWKYALKSSFCDIYKEEFVKTKKSYFFKLSVLYRIYVNILWKITPHFLKNQRKTYKDIAKNINNLIKNKHLILECNNEIENILK